MRPPSALHHAVDRALHRASEHADPRARRRAGTLYFATALLAAGVLGAACPAEITRCNVDAECGAAEVCREGTCQERACPTFYRDADDDGAGDGAAGQVLCDALAGFVVGDDDCDDADAESFPGAPELVADGVDQDCDGADHCFVDGDGDGVGGTEIASAAGALGDGGQAFACDGHANLSSRGDDCDDTDPLRAPSTVEVPGDGRDGDCDGRELCFIDVDLDGFGGAATVPSAAPDCPEAGTAARGGDCDDDAVAVFPGAPESVADGVDQDCDGVDRCFVDADGDRHGTAETGDALTLSCDGPGTSLVSDDCDDIDANAHPGASELPGSGVDEDCDGLELCFVDADGDGVGASTTVATDDIACSLAGHASSDGDCADGDPAVRPGELCDDANLCTSGDLCGLEAVCSGPPLALCGCAPSCAAGEPGCCTEQCSNGCNECVGRDCAIDCSSTSCEVGCRGGATCGVSVVGTVSALACDASTCAFGPVSGTASDIACIDSVCRVEVSANADIVCSDSVCALDARGALACESSVCSGSLRNASAVCSAGSDCDLVCPSGTSCRVTCQDDASCALRCTGNPTVCDVSCPGDLEETCDNGAIVCNRSCPP